MPTYEFTCDDCSDNFEVFLRLAEDLPTICEKCGGPLYQNYQAPAGRVVGETTVGSLADINAAKMSDEEKRRRAKDYKTRKQDVMGGRLPGKVDKTKGETPWWREGSEKTLKELGDMTKEQQKRYIETGK